MAALTAAVPFARAFFRVEVNYNEGWNVYNANLVATGQMLYPVKYGWTTVNYPMLSFVLMAWLHRITHEYLFTARVVSLMSLTACGVLVAGIVRKLGTSWRSAALAGLFCIAMFSANANEYVGMDDPQMLAQVFFLAGLWVYLRRRESRLMIAMAALLFVTGGCIKHNLIDFPLAVLIDLAIVSGRRAVWFVLCGLGFAAIAFSLNVHYGGPEFLAQMLAPRAYIAAKVPGQYVNVFGPLLLPFSAAVYTAIKLRKDTTKRIAAILFVTAIVVGGYFGGGKGVSINCLFSAMLAMAILVGLFWDGIEANQWGWAQRLVGKYASLVLFLWLAIPLVLSGNWNPVGRLREVAAAEKGFDNEVEQLRMQPGPALCESTLRCYFAGKPYVYDPFNATRMIDFGKLDAGVVVEDLRNHRYGAVQFDGPLNEEIRSERFSGVILDAVKTNYTLATQDAADDIYVPRTSAGEAVDRSLRRVLGQPDTGELPAR